MDWVVPVDDDGDLRLGPLFEPRGGAVVAYTRHFVQKPLGGVDPDARSEVTVSSAAVALFVLRAAARDASFELVATETAEQRVAAMAAAGVAMPRSGAELALRGAVRAVAALLGAGGAVKQE
jgi:hypothetical protein